MASFVVGTAVTAASRDGRIVQSSRVCSAVAIGSDVSRPERFCASNPALSFSTRKAFSGRRLAVSSQSIHTSARSLPVIIAASVEQLKTDLENIDRQLKLMSEEEKYYLANGLDASRYSKGRQAMLEKRAVIEQELNGGASSVGSSTPPPRSASPVAAGNPSALQAEIDNLDRRIQLIKDEQVYYEKQGLDSSKYVAGLKAALEIRAELVEKLGGSSYAPPSSPVPLTTTPKPSAGGVRSAAVIKADLENLDRRLVLIKNEQAYYEKHGMDASRYIEGHKKALEIRAALVEELNYYGGSAPTPAPPTPYPSSPVGGSSSPVLSKSGKSAAQLRGDIANLDRQIPLIQAEFEYYEKAGLDASKYRTGLQQAVAMREALTRELGTL
eukprot:CAMPEP_0184656496 /NCGR_PEP_ID=MMETSP0308-20130426/16545_1 /TAXON_ID=38269 /ORGANISM="Gloeochaete witrockiana, Strain SAG 46.84" /LENGTH=383 /DNA_ID=CAMNT_0027093653 /DNA_START=83 /DNA_END=1234 /DNA_ORIENTATION=+